MSELLFILCLVAFCSFFWQQRKHAELAKQLINKRCEQLDLQLISIARKEISLKPGGNFLSVTFEFEFSSDNENKYIGMLTLKGGQSYQFTIPPYRI